MKERHEKHTPSKTIPSANPAANEWDSLSIAFSISGPGGLDISCNNILTRCLSIVSIYSNPVLSKAATCAE